MRDKKCIIIGAGPAGLTAAYFLLKLTDYKPVILEETPYIGGISRTHYYNGNRMDLGGHRFFTKNDEVMKLWQELFSIQQMPASDDIILKRLDKFKNTKNNQIKSGNPEVEDKVFLIRNRLSRIYFNKRFFDYPISLNIETFKNLGIKNIIDITIGYLNSCIKKREEKSLEDFYINRFGCSLYKLFFENYTEKVWGKHPRMISPDWGKQRVKGLSIFKVIIGCLLKYNNKKVETSLIKEFLYPKFGPGQLYEYMAQEIERMGGTLILNEKVNKIITRNNNIKEVVTINKQQAENKYECDVVFSSMPIKDLISSMNVIDEEIRNIGENLPYRSMITVGLLVKKFAIKNTSKYKTISDIIPDCWIYIQEKNVKIGRLQIYNNWSPYLVKDIRNTVWLGLEYFCTENDDMWNMPNDKFINLAIDELGKIGIIDSKDVIDNTIIRVKKAYPAYWGTYKEFGKLKTYLNSIDNLYCIGRNGQHKYNNMDTSILTGIEAVKAYICSLDKTKLWNVNTEQTYCEER